MRNNTDSEMGVWMAHGWILVRKSGIIEIFELCPFCLNYREFVSHVMMLRSSLSGNQYF